jgi:hypothetical protein
LPLAIARKEICEWGFEDPFSLILIVERVSGSDDEFECMIQGAVIWNELLEVFKIVLQQCQWFAEECRGWTIAVGRSSVPWSIVVFDDFPNSGGALDALGWRGSALDALEHFIPRCRE